MSTDGKDARRRGPQIAQTKRRRSQDRVGTADARRWTYRGLRPQPKGVGRPGRPDSAGSLVTLFARSASSGGNIHCPRTRAAVQKSAPSEPAEAAHSGHWRCAPEPVPVLCVGWAVRTTPRGQGYSSASSAMRYKSGPKLSSLFRRSCTCAMQMDADKNGHIQRGINQRGTTDEHG